MEKRPSRFFNKQTAYLIVMLFFAGGAMFRILKPYFDASEEEEKTTPVNTGEQKKFASVVKVIDGDTIKVRYQGELVSVRMLRINTPEKGYPGYKEATDHLRGLVGTEIRIEFEKPGDPNRDRYNRLLVYVYSGDKNLNLAMVEAGWSRFWTKYGAGRLADEFRQAENQARIKNRGLWSDL